MQINSSGFSINTTAVRNEVSVQLAGRQEKYRNNLVHRIEIDVLETS